MNSLLSDGTKPRPLARIRASESVYQVSRLNRYEQSLILISSSVKPKFRFILNILIPQKDSDMSRGGTVPWGRIQAHNPRPRTTGVGPATINFVINPSLQANAVDFVKESAFGEGFLSLKMSTRG